MTCCHISKTFLLKYFLNYLLLVYKANAKIHHILDNYTLFNCMFVYQNDIKIIKWSYIYTLWRRGGFFLHLFVILADFAQWIQKQFTQYSANSLIHYFWTIIYWELFLNYVYIFSFAYSYVFFWRILIKPSHLQIISPRYGDSK